MGHGGRAQIVSIRYFHTLHFYGAFRGPRQSGAGRLHWQRDLLIESICHSALLSKCKYVWILDTLKYLINVLKRFITESVSQNSKAQYDVKVNRK